MPTDHPFEQRLASLYAVSVPAELDQRIVQAMRTVPIRRSGRTRPRLLAALAVAAIVATMAAVPAFQWFAGWHGPFDRLWEISTPVDQTVTAEGYRVTLHRAYADRLGVRLAMTVEDLEGRWSELSVEAAHVTDARGRVYEGWNWSGTRTPDDGSAEVWSRFLSPDDALGDDLQLRVTVTSLAVRLPEPIPREMDPERIWTTVGGAWNFELDVPFTHGQTNSPAANASTNGVAIHLDELGVVPSATVVRLSVEDLPEMPGGNVYGWYPVTRIEHDGEPLTDDPLEPGVVGSDGMVTLEVSPVVDTLAGHWTITVLQFHYFDPTRNQFGEVEGPWVLEFDVAATP